MTADIHPKKQQVCIWLTRDEQDDPELQEELKQIIHAYSDQKYMVVVFHSGKDDHLYEDTLEMLAHNRRLAAKKEA